MHDQAEVIVIGGGPGGICAALSAAREGNKTILITDRPVLGGNSSSEIRVWTRGATGAGSFFAEEMGIWGELKLKNLYMNPEGNPVFWDDVLLDAVLAEENLTLFLNTHITSVKLAEGQLESVSGFQMTSEKELEFSGAMFIDATGDGSIGALSGVPYRVGKEGQEEYGESIAPSRGDGKTFGNTLFYFTEKSSMKVTYRAPDYAYRIEEIEAFLDQGGRIVNETMSGCDYWWFETGGTKDTIADAQDIALDLKRLVSGVWNYIKNSGKFDADYLTLSWEGNLPGKRESRRMVTEWVVRQQDVEARTGFLDAAFYGGWYLDFHPSDGIHTDEDFCVQIPVQVYGMPLRCLYNRQVENLLFAGRNIGTSHVTFASSRIMNTCALSGQAAGVLAASCIRLDIAPAALQARDIAGIQRKLLEGDVLLPGIAVSNPANLALQAEIGVSSVETEGMTEESRTIPLKPGDFLIVPSRAGQVELLLETQRALAICYNCYAFDLPSKLADKQSVMTGRISLTPGKQWYPLMLPKLEEDQFLLLVIKEADDIEIWSGDRQLTGFLGGSKDSAKLWYPCIRFSNPALYGPAELQNGYNRPWKVPNVWISGWEPMPSIVYSWKKMVTISRLELYFNPDLSQELTSSRASSWNSHHMFEPRLEMPPQLVKDFAVYAWQHEDWVLVAEVKDNWQRRRSVKLKTPVAAVKLMIRLCATYGSAHGEVFQVDIY